MPKIHQFKLKEEEILVRKYYYATIPLPRLDGMLFGCTCGHWDITHKENGECWHNETGLCSCKKFIAKEFEIKVEITEADIFEFEVKDHSERDSFNWWNEFNLWSLRNGKQDL